MSVRLPLELLSLLLVVFFERLEENKRYNFSVVEFGKKNSLIILDQDSNIVQENELYASYNNIETAFWEVAYG